ncbi:SSI family serine proteinase inhibitor [Streptomyces sp. 8N706]|uniref:SSI family serine proteinase inhibitor n=1 Tax=Streptomyces sp. 8N706 TaxID=3457416 RepID=UPI003FD03B17
MLLRRLAVTALSAAAALTAAPVAGAAALPVPYPMPLPASETPAADTDPVPPTFVPPAGEDRLTVTVTGSGDRGMDGTYTLDCHPAGGTHPSARDACDRLDEMTRWGADPFAPVSPRSNCTMIHGGPATAQVTGTWAGRPVTARFNRANGCEIERWNRLRPLLPDTSF